MADVTDVKSPMKSTTLWGICIAWIGVKLQQVLAPYGVPVEVIHGLTDMLTESGLILAVIGRTVASKKLGL